MRFLRVRLAADSASLTAIADFYRRLGLPVTAWDGEVSIVVGETILDFIAAPGDHFYHFALLVPGNRFDAALAWATERTQLLPSAASGERVFDFDAWNAHACYFHDPTGNIVELIAHRGVDENDADGEFAAAELVGLSELGLVGDPRAMADPLERRLGLEVWDGTIDVPNSLAFVGEPARTLILAPEGRGWMPTGRRSQRHELDAVVSGPREGEVELEGSRYRIRARLS